MRRSIVDSSVFAEVGYSPLGESLEILFHSGEVYRYSGVPEAIYRELMRAESHGQFFNEFIKEKYPFERR